MLRCDLPFQLAHQQPLVKDRHLASKWPSSVLAPWPKTQMLRATSVGSSPAREDELDVMLINKGIMQRNVPDVLIFSVILLWDLKLAPD